MSDCPLKTLFMILGDGYKNQLVLETEVDVDLRFRESRNRSDRTGNVTLT